jgi:hypothetical protein
LVVRNEKNKPQVRDLAVPVNTNIAKSSLVALEERDLEREKLKQRVLQHHESQKEEEAQHGSEFHIRVRLINRAPQFGSCNLCSLGRKTQGCRIGCSACNCQQHSDFHHTCQVQNASNAILNLLTIVLRSFNSFPAVSSAQSGSKGKGKGQ